MRDNGMSIKKINKEYLKLGNEIPLFVRLFFMKKKKAAHGSGKILIVDTCLIGDFMASLPALNDFIKRNKGKTVDLVVSPPLRALAEKITGVRAVFVARSVYAREREKHAHTEQQFDEYEKIIVLRISRDAYEIIKNVRADAIETGIVMFLKYGIHLFANIVMRRTPRQWREINAEMLGGKYSDVPFDALFAFTPEDYERVKKKSAINGDKKKIIVHTSSPWPMKCWDNDKWIAVLKKIHALDGYTFIFVGGNDDAADYEYISSQLDFPVTSLIGQIDLADLMCVLRLSDHCIGIDSGPRNMAHVADVRSVTILGPGPHMFMPIHKNDMVVDKSNGRGLYQMFFHKKNSFIRKIEVDDVYAAFMVMVGGEGKNRA